MSKLTSAIADIEKSNEQLFNLCDEILATLQVNITRHDIMFKHPQAGSQCFYELMKYWRAKLDQLDRLKP